MSVVDIHTHRRRDTDGRPTAMRWRPSRAGILNVARYMRETLTFRDGWLELIGPNGSGKSMAVELLFPFLFDADMSPRRLSTFGEADRPMRDRMVGARTGITTSSRTGYVWAEFHRPAADGSPNAYFTIGARLSASKNARNVDVDYFTSTARINADGSPVDDGLDLLTETDTPLTVSALKEALGEIGQVYPTATAYKKAVREKLFEGLNEDKFQALVGALIQLRRPKLSENLSDAHVSELLTAALPGLDEAKVGQLATSFAELQRHEDEVERLDSHVQDVRQLRDRQRTYARRLLNRAASDTINARSQRDNARRDQRTADTRLEEVEQKIEKAETAKSDLDKQLKLTTTDHRTTIHSDAYKQAQQLALLEQRAHDAAQRAGLAEQRVDEQKQVVAEAAERADEAARRVDEQQQQATDLLDDQVGPLARELLLADDLAATSDLPVDQAQARVTTHLERRGEQIAAVAGLLNRLSAKTDQRDRLAEELEDAQNKFGQAVTGEQEAVDALGQAITDQQEALVTWAADQTPHLQLADLAEKLAGAVDEDPAASRTRVDTLVRDRLDQTTGSIDAAAAKVEANIDALDGERSELADELDRLRRDEEDDRDIAPPTPTWRTADRDGRDGWPLWRTVAFRTGVDEQVRARVEAALEASGLLDAWLSPDGQLHSLDGHDLQVVTRQDGPAGEAGTLLEVLRPEDDHPDTALVAGVLASVSYGTSTATADTAVAVGADGSFRVGQFHGTSTKAAAELIGVAARQRTRASRIAELEERSSVLADEIRTLTGQVAGLREQRRQAVDEYRTLPDFGALEDAEHEVDRARRLVADRRSAVQRIDGQHREVDEQARALQRQLADAAAQAQLPTEPGRLEQLTATLRALTNACNRWLNARAAAQRERETTRLRREAADREAVRLRSLEEALNSDADEADNLRRAVETARSNADEDTLTITSKVERLEQRIEQLQEQITELAGTIGDLREQRGELRSKAAEAVLAYQERQQVLDGHYERVAALHREGLFAEAALDNLPDVTGGVGPDHATATLDLVRAVTDGLSTMPEHLYEHANIERQQGNVADAIHELSRSLSGRAELAHVLQEDSDHWAVEATFEQQTMNAAGLYDAMQHALDEERRLLKDHEREVLEETLTGSLRSHVAAQLRLARTLVDGISDLLSTVRTASGMQVTLRWVTRRDLPASVKQARDLLKYDLARLDDGDKKALFDFFRERLDQLRYDEELEGAHRTYEERLMDLFDYRDWHEFKIDVSMPRDEDGEATTKGSLSGGERSVALHLPLFAVVAAHYASAPQAPRMIILDELFVGIDPGNQRQLLAVMQELDLDAVVTSDSVWLAVAEVGGVAIHDVQPDDPDAGVTTIRFTWDGHELVADTDPGQPTLLDA